MSDWGQSGSVAWARQDVRDAPGESPGGSRTGLSTLPSVPALLLWCGAGWGREERGCTGCSVSL